MRRPCTRKAQRGWAGLVVLLIAVAVVGFLARDALRGYGMGARPAGAGAAASGGPAPSASTASSPVAAPVERARAVESLVRQGADERARSADEAAR